MSAPESHISTPAVEMSGGSPRRTRMKEHERSGALSPRAAQRTAHGSNPISPATPSSRPRDGGSAAGARTREDIRLPQQSEDRRKGGLTTDLYGNLLRVDLLDGRAIEYEVDGAGRRVGRRELDADGFEISFRGWIYRDLLRPIAEVDRDGNVVARYVYGDGGAFGQDSLRQLEVRLGTAVDEEMALAQMEVPTFIEQLGMDGSVIGTQRFVTDQVGQIVALIDTATGELLERREYDEFGRTLFRSSSIVHPFGISGGLWDEDTGLTRLGARDYLPDLGRWSSRDSLKISAGTNALDYVFNDPLNRTDQAGLFGVAGGVIGGVVGCIAGATAAAAGVGASAAANSGNQSCGGPKSPLPAMAGGCAAGALRGAISGVTGVGLVTTIAGGFLAGGVSGAVD